ncbi:ATP-dependent DNA helicase RecG [Motilibacter rhizosphaerae]|uniref:ATP-dependent DNA helicase RecG n=1 Tax=Motilibacter rhizosphaerae TaxID=598652 RepID=A0A4Q7NGP5_9ACTN|nr:OB-fold nucleic acid binding domain-containing protein [Motilibacter rhizosphaerae]RZS82964.1 ATP-dependent DNA helicase RecG [Motilibacter rhizosphaerae]
MATTAKSGLLRRAIERLTASDEEVEAQALRETVEKHGCHSIARCTDRQLVTVEGTLRTVTLRPRAGVPALEAEVYDGTATLHVVWLGRRRIPGIDPGRAVRATGRVAIDAGRRVMFNPVYELRAQTR